MKSKAPKTRNPIATVLRRNFKVHVIRPRKGKGSYSRKGRQYGEV